MQIAYFWQSTKSIIFRVLIDFLHSPFLQFAFASLIILNGLMDLWICFKICVILYWAFLSEEWRIVHQKKYLNRRPPSFNQIDFSQIYFTFVSNKIDSWPQDFLIFTDDGKQFSEDQKLKFMSLSVSQLYVKFYF